MKHMSDGIDVKSIKSVIIKKNKLNQYFLILKVSCRDERENYKPLGFRMPRGNLTLGRRCFITADPTPKYKCLKRFKDKFQKPDVTTLILKIDRLIYLRETGRTRGFSKHDYRRITNKITRLWYKRDNILKNFYYQVSSYYMKTYSVLCTLPSNEPLVRTDYMFVSSETKMLTRIADTTGWQDFINILRFKALNQGTPYINKITTKIDIEIEFNQADSGLRYEKCFNGQYCLPKLRRGRRH